MRSSSVPCKFCIHTIAEVSSAELRENLTFYLFNNRYGENFCRSTRRAFVAIVSNIALVALVTFLGDIIQRFGQVLITLAAMLFCWIWIDNSPEFGFGGDDQLYSFATPVAVTGILSWFTAGEVLSVYSIAVDTILLSYVQDKRLSDYRENHKRKAKPSLEATMSKHELRDPQLIREASSFTIH